MKSVYSANNSLDAHLIKGLLMNHGIEAFVLGDFLQGGIGELPAFGLVQVRVKPADEAEALAIIRAFETDEGFTGDFDGDFDAEFEA